MPTPEQIKQARMSLGLTQYHAAAALAVTRVTWARYECGARPMNDVEWLFWQHVTGIKRIPFKVFRPPR